MAGYNYVCVDANGKQKKGQIEAVDEEKVLQILRNEGMVPVTVTEQNVLNKRTELNLSKPIKPRDLSVFCRQLVSIISSGVSVVNALFMLSEQTENSRLKAAIRDTQTLVEKGETLSSAMRQHPKEFPMILINMVEAGEATGSLENAFERMAVHFEKTAKTKALIRKAMIYPIVICFIALIVVIVMLVFVIPSFMRMFDDMEIDMPAITMALVNLSDFIKTKWYLILTVLAIIMACIRCFKKTPTGKILFSKAALRIPVVGKFIIKSQSASYSRTLSTLIGSGIPMVEAIDITGKTLTNEMFRRAVLAAKNDVERGVPLSTQLEASGVFPPMVYHMTKIGEETGNLEDMLVKVADYYEEEVEVGTETLTTAIEPLIIVLLAGVVAMMVFAVLAPMFTMYENLDTMYE